MQKEDYDMDDMEGKTKLTFKTIKGKPNKNPDDFALVINQVCPEVQFNGQTCLRILTGSPVEFRSFKNFCHKSIWETFCARVRTYTFPRAYSCSNPNRGNIKRVCSRKYKTKI